MARIPGSDEIGTYWLVALASELSNGRLDCPTCRQKAVPVGIHGVTVSNKSPFEKSQGTPDLHNKYDLVLAICAGCAEHVLIIRKWHNEYPRHGTVGDSTQVVDWLRRIQPEGRAPRKFNHTEDNYLKDYNAACRTLHVSAEASACMSRRCLQSILKDQGYKQKDLGSQIEALLNEADPRKALPLSLHQCIDAVRGFGNFGAHIQHDLNTLEIIPVEPGEAEWCIEITENLMEHYFERLKEMQAKIDAANSKFGAAGKPSIKM